MADSERRDRPRVEVRKVVKIRHPEGDVEEVGIAHDISAHGVRVKDCRVVPIGQRVDCNILFSPRQPIDVACRVVWAGEPDEEGFGEMGLSFEDVTEGREGRIAELVERLGSGKGALPPRDVFAESGTWNADELSRSIERRPIAGPRVYSARTVMIMGAALGIALVACGVLAALLLTR